MAVHLFLAATMKMAGAIQRSTDVMQAMRSLIKLPEIQQNMMELSKEMAKVKLCIGVAMVIPPNRQY